MNKSVYVLDTPRNCKECPITKCSAFNVADERPQDCPLRKLPDKEPCNYYTSEGYVPGYAKGWNDYHDKITGEWNNYKPEPYKEK